MQLFCSLLAGSEEERGGEMFQCLKLLSVTEVDQLTDAMYRGLRTLSTQQGVSQGEHIPLDWPAHQGRGARPQQPRHFCQWRSAFPSARRSITDIFSLLDKDVRSLDLSS